MAKEDVCHGDLYKLRTIEECRKLARDYPEFKDLFLREYRHWDLVDPVLIYESIIHQLCNPEEANLSEPQFLHVQHVNNSIYITRLI